MDVISGRKKSLELKLAEDLTVPEADQDQGKFSKVIHSPDQVYAAVRQGDVLGTMDIMYDGKKIASANLVAAESIEKKSFFLAVYQGVARCVQFILA